MVLNGGFENGTLIPGEAQDWTVNILSRLEIAGFGEYEVPIDTFSWYEFLSDFETTIVVPFSDNEFYDTMDWCVLQDTWTTPFSFTDNMAWGTFDDTYIPTQVSSIEHFNWSIFNNIWIPGTQGLFNGTDVYESFDNGW